MVFLVPVLNDAMVMEEVDIKNPEFQYDCLALGMQ